MPIGAVQRTSDRARRDLSLPVRRIATSARRRDSCTEVSRSAWQSADRYDDATDATERTDDSERGKIGHSSEHRAGNNRRPGEAAEFTGETCCSQIPCVGRGRLELTTERWHWEMWRRRSCLRAGKFHFASFISESDSAWSWCGAIAGLPTRTAGSKHLHGIVAVRLLLSEYITAGSTEKAARARECLRQTKSETSISVRWVGEKFIW